MPILRTDFPSLSTRLDNIFSEAAAQNVAEMIGPRVFDVADTVRYSYEYQALHGASGIQKLAEGQDFPSVNNQEGDSASWIQSHYGAKLSVSKTSRLFDDYDKIDEQPRSLADDSFQKIDQSMADYLIKGFATTAYNDVYGESVSAAGLDGLAFFTTVHTNGSNSETFRNQIRYNSTENPLLSREAVVEARVDARNHKAVNGINTPIRLDTLLVNPALEDHALRIVGSQLLPGESTNDINPIKGLVKVQVWEKLTAAADATDATAFWFMMDSKKSGKSLKARFAERPSLDAPDQVYDNKNWDWTLDYYYTLGRAWPAYIWGSNGTES